MSVGEQELNVSDKRMINNLTKHIGEKLQLNSFELVKRPDWKEPDLYQQYLSQVDAEKTLFLEKMNNHQKQQKQVDLDDTLG